MSRVANAGRRAAALEQHRAGAARELCGDERARRISQRYLPSREAIVEILQACSISCTRAISAGAT
jgi:hypothetical protein